MRISRTATIIAALIVTTACSAGTAPPITGVFVLATVGGEPLPGATMTEGSETIVADTLLFTISTGPRGLRQVEHRAAFRQPDGALRSIVYRLEYEHRANELVFLAPPCPRPEITECLFVPRSARLAGTELTITFANPAFRPQLFVRPAI